ncbi:MAG: acyl-CoA dehydrogenase family protein, partial [Acidimicrobiales bacterium]
MRYAGASGDRPACRRRLQDPGVPTARSGLGVVVVEDVESFARRARYWIDSNIPSLGEVAEPRTTREQVESARSLQRAIFDAGFAGITWPEEFGGQNLTAAHMHAFSNALHGHENPYLMLSVSLGVIGPTLLEFGTTE